VQFADAVRRLAADPVLVARLREQGRAMVLESGTWDAISAAWPRRLGTLA